MKIVSGLFESYLEADEAISALNLECFDRQNMSVLAQEEVVRRETEDASATAEDAGKGAGIGSIIGLIAGVAPIIIPGIGPLITAGSLLGGAIAGAGIGAAAGGIVGLFRDWFGGEDYAREIEAALKKGHILIAVDASDAKQERAENILRRHGAYHINVNEVSQERATA